MKNYELINKMWGLDTALEEHAIGMLLTEVGRNYYIENLCNGSAVSGCLIRYKELVEWLNDDAPALQEGLRVLF